jgi:RNA polymerase sigma factor (sigma-70 family)
VKSLKLNVRSRSYIEDLYQEGMLALVRKQHKIRDDWDVRQRVIYMYKIARRAMIRVLTRKIYDLDYDRPNKRVVMFLSEENPAYADIEYIMPDADVSIDFAKVLSTLPHNYAIILRDVVYNGRGLAEIANEQGCTYENIRYQYVRALEMLRNRLSAYAE